ncbi:DUF6522 family protein [Rhizobium sp. BG4]|uniref:DUF6522 family protein n=1 Tax=Rhizobium sp. BG4 TaxID=2613770 RepID=UPI00193C9FE3|nr:DUF6522 family protein [Rhizobium sp. BG4]QRM47249.1 hypothetical protein F2982_28170 [Rhizobium sp. BG4]
MVEGKYHKADDPIIDGNVVSDRFGISEGEFRRYMREGFIVGRVENGVGDDEGTRRISFVFGNRQWQAVITNENAILHEIMTFRRPSPIALHRMQNLRSDKG